MNIAFLCRWKLEDGLTVSTVLPHLQALASFQEITKIIFLTLEDEVYTPVDASVKSILCNPKVKWLPILSSQHKSRVLNQISDYRQGYKTLRQVVVDEEIDVVVAHGAPAGSVADKALRNSDIPYFVTLFEPHADYMLESGVWSRFRLKYNMQKYWENLQKKRAAGLMPVTEGFKKILLQEGIPAANVVAVPCSVDTVLFEFDAQMRAKVRKQLGWENTLVGVYAGKYGGLYYNNEAFEIYRTCFEEIPDFRLLILSPQPEHEILQQLQKYNLDLSKVQVTSLQHAAVPAYLSAADFAFATYKPAPSKRFLSPVKIGEYWANGLPVLLTEGIGDDSDIITKEGGGALFNLQQQESIKQALQKIQTILQDQAHRHEIPKLAVKYRSPDKVRAAYEYFFNQLQQKGL
ncbi:glycosyltransferase [Pontibacter sp. KCTC 32443]|uniref:glycosyltransferase n=1 Tax=Pontibacter TaxID=323449 RepID=UPI00164EA481|nr:MULTISPECIES: glycosyltransferase [Pontibacter]MBC5775456.1 glycosyltransferase [Pontibacter sp. KCTC 32443]